jgi:hypothetical protein
VTTAQLPASGLALAEARTVVAERSGGLCELCGHHAAVQFHHRKPRGIGGSSSRNPAIHAPTNLLHLCQHCRGDAEQHPDRWDFGWKVHCRADPARVPVLYRAGWALLTHDGQVTAC